MTLQKTLTLFLTLLICSCNASNGLEESIIIYNPEKHQLFIKMLDNKKVDYRIQDNGQIFYSPKQKEIAIKAFEKVMGNKIRDLQPPPNSSQM